MRELDTFQHRPVVQWFYQLVHYEHQQFSDRTSYWELPSWGLGLAISAAVSVILARSTAHIRHCVDSINEFRFAKEAYHL